MNESTPQGDLTIHFKPARIEIEAVVIRTNGQREELGVIAALKSSPLRRAWRVAQHQLTSWFGALPRGRK
jgi:hypothetical protein